MHKTFFSTKVREFLGAREDILGGTTGQGALLFRFYQDIIGLRLHHPALRTHQLNLAYVHNVNRVIAFLRPEPTEQLLVIASLANTAFCQWICHCGRIKHCPTETGRKSLTVMPITTVVPMWEILERSSPQAKEISGSAFRLTGFWYSQRHSVICPSNCKGQGGER